MPWAPNTPRNAVPSHHRATPPALPQDGHRRHPAEARCGAWPLDVVDGDQLRQGPGLDRHRQALVAGDAGRSRRQHAGRRKQAAQRDPGARPAAALDRPDVERQPDARGRAGRLGGDRPRAAHRLGAVAGPSRRQPALGGRTQRQALAVGDRPTGTRPASAGGAFAEPAPADAQARAATSASRPRNGTATRSTGRSRRCTCWPPTGCSSTARPSRTGSDAERQRLNFHLQQFVDAMSPTLLLLSNPAALRKAMETGGASLAAGAQNLLADLKEGRLSHGRYHGLRAGPQHGHDAGQGGLPQPADRADPVRADDQDGPRGADHDHAALDQQVLHPRPAAEEQHGPLSGRAGLHGLRRLLEEPGRLDGRDRVRGLHGPRPAGGLRRGARHHRQRHRQRHGLLHRRHAADHDAGLAGDTGRQAVQLGDLHGLDAGLLQGRRYRASSWARTRSTSSSSR